jgi:hypothetical protein
MMKLYLTLRFSTTDGYHIDRHSQKELELCSSKNCDRFKNWYASLNLTLKGPFSRLQASLQKFLDGSYSGSVAEHGQLDWFVCDACFYVFRSLVINWRLQLKQLVVLISSLHALQKIDTFIHITATGDWIQTIYIHSSRHGYCKCRTSTHCENQSIFLPCLWLYTGGLFASNNL